ncbi:MAG: hypothetical protein LBS59_00425 [Puniceicoccales bacterium]|jgi:uncharacterized repeat protein (TIGR04138 family)|nr:hypothetical protein [Puniceicoccales bacterium]
MDTNDERFPTKEAKSDIIDSQYAGAAYSFVREALNRTVAKIAKKSPRRSAPDAVGTQHISGAELLEGLREFALDQYGPLAELLLYHWGVKKTDDFGNIVFNMVEAGVLGKTDNDKPEDFSDKYNFAEVFRRPFLPSRATVKSVARAVVAATTTPPATVRKRKTK